MPSTPLGVAMTSTSSPCLAKIPAERAIHGGIIDPDKEVNAIRSLGGYGESAAGERWCARLKTKRAPVSRTAERFFMSLPAVESFRIFSQDVCFCLIRNVLAAA